MPDDVTVVQNKVGVRLTGEGWEVWRRLLGAWSLWAITVERQQAVRWIWLYCNGMSLGEAQGILTKEQWRFEDAQNS